MIVGFLPIGLIGQDFSTFAGLFSNTALEICVAHKVTDFCSGLNELRFSCGYFKKKKIIIIMDSYTLINEQDGFVMVFAFLLNLHSVLFQ